MWIVLATPNLVAMSSSDAPWTLDRESFDLARVLAMKQKTTVSVVIPARNEAATVGAVIEAVRHHADFVDELVVVDDHSNDDTPTVAEHHGRDSCTSKVAAARAKQ